MAINNSAPTDIYSIYGELLDIKENATWEQQLGRLHVTDPDTGDSHTLSEREIIAL